MNSGFKGIFWSWLPSMFTRKRKLTCSSVEKFSLSSHMLGSKLVMGQRTSLFSLKHLVKTDKDDNIFPRQSQTTGAPAFRQDLCWLLTLYPRWIIIKNHRLPKTPIFSGYWLSKCSQGAVVTRMVLSLTVLKWINLVKLSEMRPIHFIFEAVISIVCCGSCRWSNSF